MNGLHQRRYHQRGATYRPSNERNGAVRRVHWAVEPWGRGLRSSGRWRHNPRSSATSSRRRLVKTRAAWNQIWVIIVIIKKIWRAARERDAGDREGLIARRGSTGTRKRWRKRRILIGASLNWALYLAPSRWGSCSSWATKRMLHCR